MTKKKQISDREFLSSETNTISRRGRGRINVALVYPNTYPVGMASLGFQTVYRLFNEVEDVVCERAFLPQTGPFQSTGIRTLETRRALNRFDIIAFSLSFENDYPHVLDILDSAGLPLKAADRNSRFPLIMAGGVACFLNPEPLSLFMDCFLIGEAEPIIPEFFNIYDPGASRGANLSALARNVPGVYVPSFYEKRFFTDGAVKSFEPAKDVPEKIRRPHVENISDISTTSTVITPHTPFGRTFLIEVGRGCPHGCRFCSTGYVYRPPRFRNLDQLTRSLEKGIGMTDRIGLVGAAVTDLPDLASLCSSVSETQVRLSFSSLRADRLSPEIIDVLKKSRVKTATIAPDAGSPRMGQVIKKGISEDSVLWAAERLVEAGIPNLKLYFMVGLPTETHDDIEAIIDMVKKVKHVFLEASRIQKRIGTITVSINPFVPKPFTPFQWAAMDGEKDLKKKIQYIKKALKTQANIRVFAETPRQAYPQALLSRGDHRIGEVLLHLHKNRGNWSKTLKETDLDTDFYVVREIPGDRILPWHFIDHGFDVTQLKKEYRRAIQIDA
jgi:radical SAM superfamily enzyme YgiQ (UPF0313 family)